MAILCSSSDPTQCESIRNKGSNSFTSSSILTQRFLNIQSYHVTGSNYSSKVNDALRTALPSVAVLLPARRDHFHCIDHSDNSAISEIVRTPPHWLTFYSDYKIKGWRFWHCTPLYWFFIIWQTYTITFVCTPFARNFRLFIAIKVFSVIIPCCRWTIGK